MTDRIGVVVRLRKLRERHAQRDLADVQRRLSAARDQMDSLRAPIFDGGERLGVEHLVALRAQGVVRAEELDLAREELERTRTSVNEAMAILHAATGRRRAAESLESHRRLARTAVAVRVAQAALDEAVVMRRAWHEAQDHDDE